MHKLSTLPLPPDRYHRLAEPFLLAYPPPPFSPPPASLFDPPSKFKN